MHKNFKIVSILTLAFLFTAQNSYALFGRDSNKAGTKKAAPAVKTAVVLNNVPATPAQRQSPPPAPVSLAATPSAQRVTGIETNAVKLAKAERGSLKPVKYPSPSDLAEVPRLPDTQKVDALQNDVRTVRLVQNLRNLQAVPGVNPPLPPKEIPQKQTSSGDNQ